MIFKRRKSVEPELETEQKLYVKPELVPDDLIQGTPLQGSFINQILVGIVHSGIDEEATHTWSRASDAFWLVAANGWSGYRFEDGDYGIDGYLVSEHPLSRESNTAISRSARAWGLGEGNNLNYTNTWINASFRVNEAQLMHDMVRCIEIGIPYEGGIFFEDGSLSGTFYEDWGRHIA